MAKKTKTPAKATSINRGTPLVEMRDISIAFGGIKAVDHAIITFIPAKSWACSATMARESPRSSRSCRAPTSAITGRSTSMATK